MTQQTVNGNDVAAEVDQIRERIHLLMWRRKISASAIARAIGVEPATVSRKLRGERGIDLGDLIAFSRALEVDPAALLAGGEAWAPWDSNPQPRDSEQTAADLHEQAGAGDYSRSANVVELDAWRAAS